ncbi:hypothetical protein [Halobellus rufus]|uniref:hypothetical protein n=1 Tax=Halobellus rufus TaxID=1448860 RepID=UPI0012DFFC8B|nr:hypothetical protein [Halobellus rufus]
MEELVGVKGVMRDDIHVNDDTVTTYVPLDRLEDPEGLEGITVKVVEEYEYEYPISAKPSKPA